jgi:hypothetical protein
MCVGSQLVTTVLALETVARGAERYPSAEAYQWAVMMIIGLTAAATLTAFALPGRRRPNGG